MERLSNLGLRLPSPPEPAANYVSFRLHDRLLFVSGQLPFESGRLPITGRVGAEVNLQQARSLARSAALNALAIAQGAVGSLDELSVLQLSVFVASTDAFDQQHRVADGASDLLVSALGDAGAHARTAVAVPVLPMSSPLEIQVTFVLNSPSSSDSNRGEK